MLICPYCSRVCDEILAQLPFSALAFLYAAKEEAE